MAEIIQNIDQDQSNPLDQNTSFSLKSISLPSNPKIKLLIILGVVIFILLIAGLIIPAKKIPPIPVSEPTAIPQISPKPTDTNQTPPQFQEKFQNIQQQLNQKEEFPFPIIDPDIGL